MGLIQLTRLRASWLTMITSHILNDPDGTGVVDHVLIQDGGPVKLVKNNYQINRNYLPMKTRRRYKEILQTTDLTFHLIYMNKITKFGDEKWRSGLPGLLCGLLSIVLKWRVQFQSMLRISIFYRGFVVIFF